MDILSILASFIVGIVSLILLYVLYMSRQYRIFKKIGVQYMTPWPAIGSVPDITKHGLMEFHRRMYKDFANEKVYGYFEGSLPMLVVRDLDMLREIMVKNFNSFVNRRDFSATEPVNHGLFFLQDEHWQHVRKLVTPAFTSGRLKWMSLLVEETAKSLTSNLREACRAGREVEMKHIASCYTIDVIANTGFGVSIDSLNDPSSRFIAEAKELIRVDQIIFASILLFPFLVRVMNKYQIGLNKKPTLEYFNSFLDAAMQNTNDEGDESQKRHDFLQMVVDQERQRSRELNSKTENASVGGDTKERTGLTLKDIQGQTLMFVMAGYDTASTVMSFTMFNLAHYPDVVKNIQEELDRELEGNAPCYDNINSLVYMEMVINETMRFYPPVFVLDRVCTQDCVISGVQFKKGMNIQFPFIGIYKDPAYFPDPEKFDPERFNPKNKGSRHPFAFLPFGQGPRNCIGMRLAQMEMKIAMAAVLQEMSPVPCSKSVNPPRLEKLFNMKALDGLWIKFIPRKED